MKHYRLVTSSGYHIAAEVESADELSYFPGVGDVIQLSAPILADRPYVHQWRGFGGVLHSLEITESWGLFLGYFMGDGSFSDTCLSIACCAQDQDVVTEVTGIIETLFGTPQRQLRGPKKGCEVVRLTRKAFVELFNALGIVKPVKGLDYLSFMRRACVPEFIWRSPRPIAQAFLSGLFEADGWVSKTGHGIVFSAKEVEFCRDVQRLLLAFDVRGRIRPVVRRLDRKEFPGHLLAIYALDAVKFGRNIGFRSIRKRSRCVEEYLRHGGGGRIPVNYGMADKVVAVEEVQLQCE